MFDTQLGKLLYIANDMSCKGEMTGAPLGSATVRRLERKQDMEFLDLCIMRRCEPLASFQERRR